MEKRKLYVNEMVGTRDNDWFSVGKEYGEKGYGLKRDIKLHKHEVLEINLVLQGRAIVMIEDIEYELQEGDIWIVDPNQYHMSFDNGNCVMLELLFRPRLILMDNELDQMYLRIFSGRKSNVLPYLTADMQVAKEIQESFLMIEKEYQENRFGYRIFIRSEILKIVGKLYRYYEENNQLLDQKSHSWKSYQSIFPVIDYINANYTQRLSRASMAEMAYMSESYFSSLFSEVTGLPFSKYVLEIRLNNSQSMLLESDLSVTDIALELGFGSVSYFDKAFKKKYGMTPNIYREKNVKTQKQ